MIAVTCPHCGARFRLPAASLGRGGARVRCAGCEGVFDWIRLREAGRRSVSEDDAISELGAAATPGTVVRLAVEELANTHAAALLDAYDRGALFERCGPELLAAWDRCRKRLGTAADPALFRDALQARLGIDLAGPVSEVEA